MSSIDRYTSRVLCQLLKVEQISVSAWAKYKYIKYMTIILMAIALGDQI